MTSDLTPAATGRAKTRDVIAILGCRESHLQSLIRRGRIRRPAKDSSGDFTWTPSNIANAREALAEAGQRLARPGQAEA